MARRKKKLDPKKAVGYIRVSGSRQEESPEAQEMELEKWCKANGVVLIGHHFDRYSGYSEGRRGLSSAVTQMIDDLAGILLVVRRGRLFRNARLMWALEYEIEKMGGRIVSCDGVGGQNPMERAMAGTVDIFNQFERDMGGLRTKVILEKIKKEGRKTGGTVPYGYIVEEVDSKKYLVKCPHEQEGIATMLRLRRRGVSYTKIASKLIGMGFLPKLGGAKWRRNTVISIIEREMPEKEDKAK